MTSAETVRNVIRSTVKPSPFFGITTIPENRDRGGDAITAGLYIAAEDVARLLLSVHSVGDLPAYIANAFGDLFGLDVPTLPAFGLLDTARPVYVLLQFEAAA